MTEMYSGLHVGQQFGSLEEFKTVVRNISVRQHWELRVIRSNKKSVVIGCRSSMNCFFRVVCRANQNETYITSLQDSHSCRRNPTSPGITPTRAEASHVRFLLSEIPKLFDLSSKIKGQDVVDAVKRYHGYDISVRQAHRALTKLQPRQLRNQTEEAHTHETSRGDQQDSQPPLDTSVDSSVYSVLSEPRWIPESIQSDLIERESIQQSVVQRNPAPPPPEVRGQAVQPQSQLEHPSQVQQQGQMSLNHGLSPPNAQQSSYILSTSNPLSVPQTEQPVSQTQTGNNGHPPASSMILTNFKIEFTCTTCGALNQSFFPNQGNATGGAYMPQHPMSGQTTITRGASPSRQTGTVPDHVATSHRYAGPPLPTHLVYGRRGHQET